ncbi:MAG: Gfo/Idh/MocA family oxidoreductase [Treponema sp.]|jgi:predicted dehydrogenase|nr:Gfo/Idh/MocA family oxidoreductase [Treponema sp.]
MTGKINLSEMDKIKAAVIGLGRIASILEDDKLREKPCTHAGAIAADSECVLCAGSDTDEERRKLFAGKWKVDVYEDPAEMLAVHKPLILSIATHPDSHHYYCKLAAEHRIPVIICEKPLADNIRRARKIVKLTDGGNGPVIIVNHERRYSEDYIRAKEILDSESLGKIKSVRAVLYAGKTRRITDMLWHDGTHLADAVMFLTGARLKHRKKYGEKLSSRGGTAWLEAVLIKSEKVKSVPVILEAGAGRDYLAFEIEFSCERGRLRIGNGIFEVYESAPSPYAENFRSLKNTGETFTGKTLYFSNMLRDAVNCVRDKQRVPRSSAADGLRVIGYLNAVSRWKR